MVEERGDASCAAGDDEELHRHDAREGHPLPQRRFQRALQASTATAGATASGWESMPKAMIAEVTSAMPSVTKMSLNEVTKRTSSPSTVAEGSA